MVCKERIIARAHNLTETLNDVTAHAEMQAITCLLYTSFFARELNFNAYDLIQYFDK